MKRLFRLLGLIAIAAGALLFAGSLFLEPVLKFYAPLMCPGGGTLSSLKQDYTLPGQNGTSVSLICTDASGNVTDVSDTATLITFGGIGLGVVLIAFSGRVGRRAASDDEDGIGEPDDVIEEPDDVIAEMGGVSGGLVVPPAHGPDTGRSSRPAASGGGNDALVRKLEELQKALEAGFITQAEYDQKREQLLNSF